MTTQLLLITGIPGTGKTTYANYLATQHGFIHLDREDFKNWPIHLKVLWKRSIRLFLTYIWLSHKKIVISWGFLPGGEDNTVISELQAQGLTMVWFDGNRTAARREFLKRGDVPVELLNAQMTRIDQMDLSEFEPIIFNSFDEQGTFLDKEEVAQKLISMAGKEPIFARQ